MADLFDSHSPPQGTSASASQSTTAERKAHRDQPRIRRRNRLITSCLECRRRKLKCDKTQPCTNCTKFGRACVFLAPAMDAAGQAKLAEVKEKMGMLEKTLEQDVAQRRSSSTSTPASGSVLPGQDDVESDQEDPEDEKGLEPTNLAVEDAAYDDGADDDLMDLGIQMGRLRITERIGGFVRPRFSEELREALKEVPEQKQDRPFGSESPGTYLSPGSDYVAPSSSFFFAPGVHKKSFMNYLPAKPLADKLIEHYWRAVHVIARTVHRPSFQWKYEMLWRDVSMGIEPPTSFQAVLLAALLASVISMPAESVQIEFSVTKESLVENFKEGTESALARANFIRTTRFETLQAFVMYLLPQCRSEVSRAHSALTGTAIRLAECLGLHRDPTVYDLPPVEAHVRRLIWYQICFLDLRTCEATGPRPQIRREDFDTRFPLNIDDVDLESEHAPTEDTSHFTDMTISRMRFECYEMHRMIWIERPKIEKKKTTLTSLLAKIQAFQAAMEKTYLPMLNKHLPLHFMAMAIYGMLSSRMHVMVLNKYMSNDKRLMPERLRQIMMGCAVQILEHSMTVEQTPALGKWAWIVGALHQYHSAITLISELYAKAYEPAVYERVWRVLDFAFDMPPAMSGGDKSRMIIEGLLARTQYYQTIRRVRAPASMTAAGPRTQGYAYQMQKIQAANREQGSSSSPSSCMQSPDRSFGVASPASGQQQQTTGTSPAPSIPESQRAPQQFSSYSGEQALGPRIAGLDFSLSDMASSSGPSPANMPVPDYQGFGSFNAIGSTDVMSAAPPTSANDSGNSLNVENTAFNFESEIARSRQDIQGRSSSVEGLLEIDWNEWDQLFGSVEVTGGNIVMPPFSFPQFSPTDLELPVDATGTGQVL